MDIHIMKEYILSCCSTADLPAEHFSKRGIFYACFHYELDGREYVDDLGKSMSFEQFYQAMTDGADTKTSQINTTEFIDYFEPFLKADKDVLHLCLSSGISGVINSAMGAKEILAEKYPDRTIYIVDSLAASSGFGLLMDRLADLRDEGMSVEDLYQWTLDNRLRLNHWFFSTDLTFFIKGGRVSRTSGTIGNMLNICPLLNVDHQGRLISRFKVRTKRKVMYAIVDKMEECIPEGTAYGGKCYISQSACYADARFVADLIEERFPNLDGKVVIHNIGTTIGAHTGPGTVAVFFWGKERVD